MMILDRVLSDSGKMERQVASALTLTFDERHRTRQRVVLDNGTEAALMLPRGTIIADGQYLSGQDGTVVRVVAAPEPLSLVQSEEPLLLLRAAYHLGNRHVPLQVQTGCLRYQADHVLDDMVRGLGLSVTRVSASFQPEAGAYRSGHADHHHAAGAHHDHPHHHHGHADHHH